jgi:4-hydroxy-4-methyl-2-oxoglutarate aldolase
MSDTATAFGEFSPTTIADVVGRDGVMDIGIRPLWPGMPRVAGPAFPVRCAPGDNLMLHAAIYRAAPGSVVVVEAGGVSHAVAGANVCGVAQRHGIAAFVVDGVIRDLAETRGIGFPVFARGVIPIPGAKRVAGVFGVPVNCGGVAVALDDIVVADEEGVVVVPGPQRENVLRKATALAATDAASTLESWEAAHHAKIEQTLRDQGFHD